jgi:hypothetical protein
MKSLVAALLVSALFTSPARAVDSFFDITYALDFTDLQLAGGPYLLPLAEDPTNLLGDSVDGYGFVNSMVTLSLSSNRPVASGPPTLGNAFATNDLNGTPSPSAPLLPIDPLQLDGQTFQVDSFFDVFFDITVTDVDSRPGRDYDNLPDGATAVLLDNGPARMSAHHTAVFDALAPDFGLPMVPIDDLVIGGGPESSFLLLDENAIPLGGDINANGHDDVLKFLLGDFHLGDPARDVTVLPDGTVRTTVGVAALMEGLVLDAIADPPFTIGLMDPASGLPDPAGFGGAGAINSMVQNPIIPEPGAASLLAVLGAAVLRRTRRQR